MDWKKPRGTREDDLADEYFEKDDDEHQNKPAAEEEDEIDPLDAYMNNLDENVKKVEHLVHDNKKNLEIMKSDDPLDSYLDSMKEKLIKEHNKKHGIKKKEGNPDDDNEELFDLEENEDDQQYDFLDSEGNLDFDAMRNKKKQKIEPLPVIDHSKIEYEAFNKNFYEEHEEIRDLPNDKVRQLRQDFEIKVHGRDVPKPIVSFAHLQFDERMTNLILKKEFEKPTPIQCQALPCGLSGRDVIGIAKTGSGKTLAYVWPLIIHILDQREVDKNEGPIGLIMCPTRELAQQVYIETKRFAKIYNIQVAALLGGENKHEQWKELKAGVDIIVATPGRLIEMVKKKATNLKRCTYIVLDEADRMFSMGFEYQVRSVIGQIRPDRQILLFSATFNGKVQKLCMDMLQDPVRINIGKDNQANEDVRQEVLVLYKPEDKLNWLLGNLPYFAQTGKTLIFANQIVACEELAQQISEGLQFPTLTLHGDKLQQERTVIVNNFKTKPDQNILVATDVASRGLDIPDIRTVINFEIPKDGDTYIHRIGRTGRAGNKEGTAYTLLMNYEIQFAITLTKILEVSGQPIPRELENLALNDDEYARNKKMNKMGFKKNNISALLEKAVTRRKRDTTGLGYDKSQNADDEDRPKKQSSYAPRSNSFISLQQQPQPSAQPLTYAQLQQQSQTTNYTAPQNPLQNMYQAPQNMYQAQQNQYQAPQVSSYMPQQQTTYQAPQRTVYGAQPTTNFVGQSTNSRDIREQIRAEYSNRMKGNMETQFRGSFVSSGTIEPTKSLPTITFRNKPPSQSNDEEPKKSNITIKLPKKKQEQVEQPEVPVMANQFEAPLVRGKFGSSAEDSIRGDADRASRKSRFSDRPAESSVEPDVGKKFKSTWDQYANN